MVCYVTPLQSVFDLTLLRVPSIQVLLIEKGHFWKYNQIHFKACFCITNIQSLVQETCNCNFFSTQNALTPQDSM